MSGKAKVLLVLSIVCLIVGGAFNAGVINPRGVDALYAILPIGAVFFGLFLIVQILPKDEETESASEHSLEASLHARAEKASQHEH